MNVCLAEIDWSKGSNSQYTDVTLQVEPPYFFVKVIIKHNILIIQKQQVLLLNSKLIHVVKNILEQ